MTIKQILLLINGAACLIGIAGCVMLRSYANDRPWTTHTVSEGAKDYSPGHKLGVQPMTTGYDIEISVPVEAWYDPSQLGEDKKDWLKAGGVSYFSLLGPQTWPKNHDSALVGFRMLSDSAWQYCAYVNDVNGKHYTGLETTAKLGDTVTVKYRYEDGLAYFWTDYPRLNDWTNRIGWNNYQVSVGPWHGGTADAPIETYIVTQLKYIR